MFTVNKYLLTNANHKNVSVK